MTDPPPRLAAALVDRYRLERELGQGGMATVYLAQDLRHHRNVAIKVLRPELAAVIGAERFLSEIRTTANLQHPHILPLFDSGEADSFLFYVMPFVAGESLRDRINREHQLPVTDAVRIATEIAGALDYAHRHGVIHRDIKPENVMLHDGQALVADFGIALAITRTTGSRMTETGMSLGTPHYMSPEQAMGEREITGRSDVYALGAITYEMLVGEPPFTGPTAQAIVARVMTEQPRPMSTQRRSIPPGVEEAVFTALEKLPADRYATAAEFAAALKNTNATALRTAMRPVAATRRVWLMTGAVGVAALAAGLLLGRTLARPAGDPGALVRGSLDLGDSTSVRPIGNVRLALDPTGRRVAFVGNDGVNSILWIRELDEETAKALPDTKGAFAPFFSPDGETVGFFTNASGHVTMRVIPVAGGVARTVVEDSVATFGGADWGDDDQIYFTHSSRSLARVASGGGTVTRISLPDSANGIKEHDYPDVLPGSKLAFVMLWKGSIASNAIGVIDLKTGVTTELVQGSYARHLAPGYIAIGVSTGRILVSRFDEGKRQLVGTPVPTVADVQNEASNGTVQFAIAANGTLVYQNQRGGSTGVVWVDHGGAVTAVDTSLKGNFSSVALSPDGGRIALAQSGSGGSEVWVKDLTSGAYSRISIDVADADRPVWTPNGDGVGFLATRGNHRTAWLRRADGSDSARTIGGAAANYDEVVFERSGRYIVFRSEGSAQGTRHLSVLEQGVDTAPRTLLRSRFDSYAMALSPDSRWMAYVSDESGHAEVYVRPFPNVDSAKVTISSGGGVEPLWSRDGSELFYRGPRGDMYSAAVLPGARFAHAAPRLLFSRSEMALQDFYRSYDVHPDGRRFLMLSNGGSETTSLRVILNWGQMVTRAVTK